MKNKKILIAVGIAVAIILIATISIIAIKTKPADKPVPTPPAVTDEGGNPMDAEQIYAMPKAMVFRGTQHSGGGDNGSEEETFPSVTIKATIEPANATNQKVDWTAVWVNPDAEWATGKSVSDYITVVPIADGSLTATVSCIDAFAEHVKIVVTSRDNSNAKAESSVDYAKKLAKTNLSYAKSYMASDKPLIFTGGPNYLYLFADVGSTGSKTSAITYDTSIGTLEDTYQTKVTLTFDVQFIRNALSYNGTIINQVSIDVTNTLGNDTSAVKALFGSDMVNNYGKYNKLVGALGMFSGSNVLKFTVQTTGTYSSKTETYYCSISTQFMSIRAAGITIDDSTLIF